MIYDLKLKCEYHGLHAAFLDLDITVFDGIHEYKLYEKRDDFPFFLFVCKFSSI